MNNKTTTEKEYCACGFPQSHPVPHEHSRTTTTKTREAELRKLDKILHSLYLEVEAGFAEDLHVKLAEYVMQEKQELLESLKSNLPEADKAEAIKHRPDNSVGFMLGWNAYESKLSKKLAEMLKVLEGKGEK